mgnify:CR=1 FL=1
MPSVSKKQQKFMGIVRSIQKGEQPASKFSKSAQKAAKKMKKSSVKKYAKTKHDDLPVKKEALSASQFKAAHKKFKDTGELPPHLKKLVKDLDKVKVKHKVKNIVVPGLEWMSKIKEERDYKDEYKKFQSSTKAKKYRAELNKYNRQKGTYGNGDGKDASHKGGKIVGFESQSKNRGRAEKSRLKKEDIRQEIEEYVDGILDAIGEEFMVNEALRPSDKKVLMVIGRDIINNIKKKNKNLKPSKQLGQALNSIFRAMTRDKDDANYQQYKKYFPKYNDKLLKRLSNAYFNEPFNVQNTFIKRVMNYALKEGVEEICLCEACQKGYKTHPTRKTKIMFGKRYRNCIKKEDVNENEITKSKINLLKVNAKYTSEEVMDLYKELNNRDVDSELIFQYLDTIKDRVRIMRKNVGLKESVNEAVYKLKRGSTNKDLDELDALLARAGFKGKPDFNKMTWSIKNKNPKIAKIIKSKGGKKIKESVDEAVSPKGWNMSKKFITILGREVKNLQKYHRQQNEEDFLEVANYRELQLKYMNKNLNESIEESDLGLT